MQEGLVLLYDLVSIPSPSGAERPAVVSMVEWMAAHGFAARIDEVGNAVGVLDGGPRPNGITRDIVLLGHIDTVAGMPVVKICDGRLYGRGSVDAKGPLAAFAAAAAMVGPQAGWRIVVVGAVEEEAATSKGARHIAATFRPEMAVIGEPSGWQRLTLGYKGRLLAEARISQALSHRSGQLASACERATAFWSRVADRIERLNSDRHRAWDQVLPSLRSFSHTSDGLTETACLEMGFRLPPDIGPEALPPLLSGLDGEVALRFYGEESAYRAAKSTPLVAAFLRAVREQGGQPGFVVKTGTSDMNVVGPVWKCPILAYGPGDSSLDHTPEEHVELEEWERGVHVLAGVLAGLR